MAAPDLRAAVRAGAAHLDTMAAELATLRAGARVEEPALRRPPARVRGPRRLHRSTSASTRRCPASASPGRVGRAAVRAVGRRADPGGARTARHRRPGPAAPRRADEPPRHRRARVDRGAPPATPRLAARRLPRPGVPRRDRDPDLGAARPPPDRVPRRLQRLPPPAGGARRPGGEGRREPGRVDRPRAGARPALPVASQVQQDARARGPPRAPPGRAGRGAEELSQAARCRPARWPAAEPARSGEIVVRVEDLVVGYLPGRGAPTRRRARRRRCRSRVARIPFLAAQRGDRIGIVGPNGAGKTTLLRTIAGDLPPIDGRLTFGNAVQLGYLAQLRGAAIPGATVLDALLEAIPVTPGEARAYLARFLFRGDDAFKEVRPLSGGERSRLELALLGIMPSNLLLLDEPTNHLDIPAREAIESFMLDSPATLLVVSPRPAAARDGLHDAVGRRRRARRAVRRRLPRVASGGGGRLDGRPRRDEQRPRGGTGRVPSRRRRPRRPGRGRRPRRPSSPSEGRRPRRPRPARRGASGSRRTPTAASGSSLDAELSRLGLRKSHLELAIGDPAVAANFVEMRRVTSELADVDAALAVAEDAWLELEERAP